MAKETQKSKDADRVSVLIGKNYKVVTEKLQSASTHSSYDGTPKFVSFA